MSNRARLRDLGITIGRHPTGPLNTITDVAGVQVGHLTLIEDSPRILRTGVTMILPREDIWQNAVFGGYFSFNGNGEMTGIPWLEEVGMIDTPIGITNTLSVGIVRDAIERAAVAKGVLDGFLLPIVAETYDGWLNDITAFAITTEHALAAIENATSGPVQEGNVGGGTGMMCHHFKGGIGTSSRMVETHSGVYTVGVLVQSNYGSRHTFRVDGVPVGQAIPYEHTPPPWGAPEERGSIIVIIATDAPLLPIQCQRLAKRATTGLARVGGYGGNESGDIFLAFATGNRLPNKPNAPYDLTMFPNEHINPLFEGVVEATEEAIINAMTAAETMTGFQGHTAHALPLDELQRIMQQANRGS